MTRSVLSPRSSTLGMLTRVELGDRKIGIAAVSDEAAVKRLRLGECLPL